MLGRHYGEILLECDVSLNTLTEIRKKLRRIFKDYLEARPVLVGGLNSIVQCDETLICRRGIIKRPSTADDGIKDTVWILGCIDEYKNFYLKRVENRKIETLTSALKGKICIGYYFFTDGHPSYSQFSKNICVVHRVVNHSEEFKSRDGTHTNVIEGFWAGLKERMRREHGIIRKNIDEWLIEFTFWK
jgi:hypothetical protein